jgi:hypothetical protein
VLAPHEAELLEAEHLVEQLGLSSQSGSGRQSESVKARMSPEVNRAPRLRALPQPRSASNATRAKGKWAIMSSMGRAEPLSTTRMRKRSAG